MDGMRREYEGEAEQERRAQRIDPTDDARILGVDPAVILSGIFGCASEVEVESTTAFARYMNRVGCNLVNYPIFLRLLQTNNRWVVDALIGKREARLLFTKIRPSGFLVSKAFQLLAFWHPGEIYEKVLQSVMGIIENAFYDPDDGYGIYRLRLADINSVGKFLDESKDQFEETNALVLNVLDRITRMGMYETNLRKQKLAKHAFDVRLAYFDSTKRCVDVIPQVLLTRLDRTGSEVSPSKPFVTYLNGAPR